MADENQTEEFETSNSAYENEDYVASSVPNDYNPYAEEEDSDVSETPEVQAGSDEDEWQPNYTFKVMDQEKEFDDFIKPVVNQENYDQIKDLYERAYGLDHIKAKSNTLREENTRLSEIETKFNQQNQSLAQLGKLINDKDWYTFFNELKIPDQEVIKYALDRVNYQDLPQEQKQEYDGNIESRQRLRTLEQQNQQYQEQLLQQQAQARANELDSYLSSPEYKQVVDNFDQRAGQPGAFKNEVIRRGQMAYYLNNGQDLSTKQVVDEVVKLFGGQVQTNDFAQAGNPMQGQTQQQTVMSTSKPVLPNLKAGAASPARKLPRTIEDIRRAAEAFGN